LNFVQKEQKGGGRKTNKQTEKKNVRHIFISKPSSATENIETHRHVAIDIIHENKLQVFFFAVEWGGGWWWVKKEEGRLFS
jgi:hypothetical protein